MKTREVLITLFHTCNDIKSLSQLHCHTLKTGFAHHSFFATKLISMYGKSTFIKNAHKLFDETPQKSVYLWNALLRSYCIDKRWTKILSLFHDMVCNGCSGDEKPDNFTIPIALKACAWLKAINLGKMIHGYVRKNDEIDYDMFVGSALIELYSKCGQMSNAKKVFDEFSTPDVVLWTSMVTGYEQNGCPESSLSFFMQMVMVEGVDPDRVTLVSVVSACAQLLDIKSGSCVHGFMIRRGLDSDLSLVNSMLNLYAKTGYVKFAANLFHKMPKRDVISWSSMIACYAHNGTSVEALNLFNDMIDKNLQPNSVTVVSALQACAVACNLIEGKKIHELSVKKGFDLEASVCTSLIDMYMKCSSPNEAIDLFQKMPNKDVVSWVALLSGYAQNGMAYKSMEVFCTMMACDVKPDAVAIVKILAACSELGRLDQSLCLHGYIIRSGLYHNAFVGASLIELYSKCGNLDSAIKIFNGLMERDVVIWSSMIAAYGVHGQGEKALNLFNLMIKTQIVEPNNVTFLSMLFACSHAGLVEEGIKIFDKMVHEYRLNPNSEHYGIMVDLFGRTGDLTKAMEIINQMPMQAGPHVWGALLGACRIHHNTEIGEVAVENLSHLDPEHAGYHILLSNMYAVDGNWDNVEKMRSLIKDKRMKKMDGISLV